MAIGAINRGDLVLIKHPILYGLYLVRNFDNVNGVVTVSPIDGRQERDRDLFDADSSPPPRAWPLQIPLGAVLAVYSASSTAQ